jgi:hypothetical protein
VNDTKAETGAPLRWDQQRRRQGPACLSDLKLDQLLLGELGEDEVERSSAHLRACAPCTQARAALVADRDAYAAADVTAHARDALARAAAVPARGWWSRWWVGAIALPALAVGAFVLMPRAPADGMRAKGDFSVAIYVKHAESAAEGGLHLGEPLHPGDRVRFKLGGSDHGYLALFGLDAKEKLSVFFPHGAQAQPQPSADGLLPGAIELDGTLGAEQIVALRCEQPVALETLIHQARTHQERFEAGCAVARYPITKEPAR